MGNDSFTKVSTRKRNQKNRILSNVMSVEDNNSFSALEFMEEDTNKKYNIVIFQK